MSSSALPPVKNRKVLRRIDYAAARTSVLGMLAALLVFVVLGSVGQLYQLDQSLTSGFALAAIITAIYRLFLVARFDNLYGAAPSRWRRLFGLGLLMQALVWGMLLAAVVVEAGLSFDFLLVAIYIIGVVSALSTSWMAALRVRQIFAVLMLAPGIVALLALQTVEGVTLALLLAAYLLYQSGLYREQYRVFWHSLNREQRAPLEGTQSVRLASSHIQLNLVYRLAHEVRTPMNSIIGMLSLLEETKLDEEQFDYHLHATQSSNLLLTLIDDVLDYSRVLTHRITLNPDWFDLRVALQESLDAYGAAAQHSGLELSCIINQHLPERLNGDSERLMQIINNLISNAIKFSEQGEICIEISYTPLSDNDGMLQVSVSDQGAGMDAAIAASLFRDEVLEQDEDVFSARRTGFGLLVCKGLVEAMGGSIHVTSEPGKGSRFWFNARLGMQPDLQDRDKLHATMSGRAALVVGAAAGNAAALTEEIGALDVSCANANDYDHALQALRGSLRQHNGFSVLLVDTFNRRDSALNLVRTVLEDPTLSAMRVILLTTLAERGEHHVQLLDSQHERLDVLVKPVHRMTLRESLRGLFDLESARPTEDRRITTEPDRVDRRRWRLLLVEDNEINQIVTRGMLDKLGYQVKTVSDGRTALSLLEREKFDLILMDCMMPEVDGLDVTRIIRNREEDTDEHVIIVAITANTMEGAEARCLAVGMDDYLAKPVHMEDLETMLNQWLRSGDEGLPEEDPTNQEGKK